MKAMNKLVKLRVLLVGLGGLGLETAKNLILSGPKAVTIFDSRATTTSDLEYNYYLNNSDIQQ
jgi:ubiquitin-activating enzyme E1